MKAIKKILNNIFIDGLSGMALGLFSTLIIGTILKQIGDLMGGTYGAYLSDLPELESVLELRTNSGSLRMYCCPRQQRE